MISPSRMLPKTLPKEFNLRMLVWFEGSRWPGAEAIGQGCRATEPQVCSARERLRSLEAVDLEVVGLATSLVDGGHGTYANGLIRRPSWMGFMTT